MPPRKPANTALARMRNKQRDQLRNAEFRAANLRKENAARTLALAESRTNDRRYKKLRVAESVLFNTSIMANKVINSFGINPRVTVETLLDPHWPAPIKAWTDYKSIRLSVDTKIIDLNDLDSVVDYISIIKGALYHEAGHILYTTPYHTLCTHAIGIEEKEPGEGEALPSYDDMCKSEFLQRCWNIIEDQRMERAVVLESPVIKRYFTVTGLEVVINKADPKTSWPFIAGRPYLPKPVYTGIRNAALADPALSHLVAPIQEVIWQYMTSNNRQEMIRYLIRFSELMSEWGLASQPRGGGDTEHSLSATPTGGFQDVPEQTDEESYQLASLNSQEPGESNDQGNLSSGMAKSESEHPDVQKPDAIAGGGVGAADNSVANAIQKGLDEIRTYIHKEATAFSEQVHNDVNALLPRDRTSTLMNRLDEIHADSICSGIVGSLEHLVDQTSPSWRFRQEHGVLDPTSFMLRDPGETDYWSGLDDIGHQGYDLSVSVLLDTSYSMSHDTDNLSVCGLAIRRACDQLGIPCTVCTYNTDYGVVYRHDEEAVPTRVRATGGTSPAPLLDMLDDQRLDKKRHLVFILTDGQWDDSATTLRHWSAPGRYFVIVGLRTGYDILQDKQPDAAVTIRDLKDLPNKFLRALSGFLA